MKKVDLDEGLRLFRQAAALAPSDAELAGVIAAALVQKESWEEAAEEAKRASDLAPGRADFWALLAEVSVKAAAHVPDPAVRWKQAEEAAGRCVAVDRRLANCHHLLGQARWRRGDEKGAATSLDEAVKQAPTDLRYRVSLADFYDKIEEPTLAIAVLDDGLRLASEADPERPAAWLALGSLLGETDQLPRAQQVLEAAKQADRTGAFPLILLELGSVYARLQPPRKQEAIQMFKAFSTRVCKGARAARYREECERVQQRSIDLGMVQ